MGSFSLIWVHLYAMMFFHSGTWTVAVGQESSVTGDRGGGGGRGGGREIGRNNNNNNNNRKGGSSSPFTTKSSVVREKRGGYDCLCPGGCFVREDIDIPLKECCEEICFEMELKG